jgi:hypothetical protein
MTSKDKYIASLGALFCLTIFLLIPADTDGQKSSPLGWAIYIALVIWLAYVGLKNGLNVVNEKHMKNGRIQHQRKGDR